MQITAKKSLFSPKKMLYEKVGEVVKDKAIEAVSLAIKLSPIDTGAFVESWQVNPRGDRTAFARGAAGRSSLPSGAKAATREEEKARLIGRIESFEVEKLNGFTITNRAPHIPEIEKNPRLRTGEKPSVIFAILKDKYR